MAILKRLDRRWIRISIYYVIALAFSFLARVHWHTGELAAGARSPYGLVWLLAGGVGPFFGALIVRAVFQPERRMSFGGTNPRIAVAMLAVPAVVMGSMGIADSFGLSSHLFGAQLGVLVALYAILEETGWRGYLQDELRDLPWLLRYSVVGLLWYGWHFSYLDGNPARDELVSLIFLLVASIGIGFVADRTRSIFAAASFHTIGNILVTSAVFETFIPVPKTRTTIVLICLPVWLVMLRVWRMRETRAARSEKAAP
jgi:membrane protease YdiL (CAAX protease family)